MKKNISFMAFSAGKESTEGGAIKRYIGVAPVKVLATNPTKAELEALYNTTLEKDVEYIGTQNVEGKDVPYTRIDFIVRTDAEKCDGIEMTTKVSYFIRKEYRFNGEKTKVQVIDKYGRTAGVTKEQANAHEILDGEDFYLHVSIFDSELQNTLSQLKKGYMDALLTYWLK